MIKVRVRGIAVAATLALVAGGLVGFGSCVAIPEPMCQTVTQNDSFYQGGVIVAHAYTNNYYCFGGPPMAPHEDVSTSLTGPGVLGGFQIAWGPPVLQSYGWSAPIGAYAAIWRTSGSLRSCATIAGYGFCSFSEDFYRTSVTTSLGTYWFNPMTCMSQCQKIT